MIRIAFANQDEVRCESFDGAAQGNQEDKFQLYWVRIAHRIQQTLDAKRGEHWEHSQDLKHKGKSLSTDSLSFVSQRFDAIDWLVNSLLFILFMAGN